MIGFLIGFMGSGKSTLGKAMQSQESYPFIDLDDYIVVRAGKPITAIFAEGGEILFRKLESEALQSLIDAQPEKMLIACGGGTPCFGNNMELMNTHGCSIYLQTSVEELYKRLKPQKQDRPLIKQVADKDLAPFIEELLKARESYYLQAQYVLPASEHTPTKLLEILSNHHN